MKFVGDLSALKKMDSAILFFTLHLWSVMGRNIEIITTLPYGIGIAPEIRTTGAAFDLAADRLVTRHGYPGTVRLKYLFNASTSSSIRTCDDIADQSAKLLSEYYYREARSDTCYAVISCPCDDERGIDSLARGLDWPLFTNGLSKSDFLDPKIGSPTAIAAGGTFVGYAKVVVEILRYYGWYRFTIIVEQKAIATFYRDIATLIRQEIKLWPLLPFEADVYTVDTESATAVTAAMTLTRARSRVVVLMCTGQAARKILDMSGDLGMANGEYAFINVQPLQGDTYGKISQFQHPLNDTSLKAFRSLIFVTYGPLGSDLTELNAAITERAKSVYNSSFPIGFQPLDLYAVETSYAIVELFATVIGEMNSPSSDGVARCSGLAVAHHMSNRTFKLTTGELFMNAEKIRNLGLRIFGFNSTASAMQPIGAYNWKTSHLDWDNERQIDWPTADGRPPSNVPTCGFRGDGGECMAKADYSTLIGVLTVVSAIIVLAFLLVGRSQYQQRRIRNFEDWGKLDAEQLLFMRRIMPVSVRHIASHVY